VDAILLDSGNQKLAVKELGGTGRTHDWTLSRAIRERIGIPLFLAGGFTPENVGQAIEEVGAFGLDCVLRRANQWSSGCREVAAVLCPGKSKIVPVGKSDPRSALLLAWVWSSRSPERRTEYPNIRL
jgi:hypothetical protein